MGAWGTDIFEDDFALDVKEEYQDLIDENKSAQEAVSILTERYSEELSDEEDNGVFWLSIVAIQIESKSLVSLTKENALSVINEGTDLDRWQDDSDLLEERKKVLESLKIQILNY